jgi:hypothetical protein
LSLYNIFTKLQIINLLFNDHLCTLWGSIKLVVGYLKPLLHGIKSKYHDT